MKEITCKTNPKIKAAIHTRDSSKFRKESQTFFSEGARLCCDAAQNGIKILSLFFTKKAQEKYASQIKIISDCAEECFEISEDISLKLSDTNNPQGIYIVCKTPDLIKKRINKNGKYVLLENLQDPANVGAVARVADALGIDGLIICGGCDIFNQKTLRASMGSLLRINVIICPCAAEFLKSAQKENILTLASTPREDAISICDVAFSGGTICVIGNEGSGVSDETAAVCTHRVTIPMGGKAESLNAATAAAIIIWEMVKNER